MKRHRSVKADYDKYIKNILDKLKKEGLNGADLQDLIKSVEWNSAVKESSKAPIVRKIIECTRNEGCPVQYCAKLGVYVLLDPDWEYPTKMFLSHEDIIALKIGWSILAQKAEDLVGLKKAQVKQAHQAINDMFESFKTGYPFEQLASKAWEGVSVGEVQTKGEKQEGVR